MADPLQSTFGVRPAVDSADGARELRDAVANVLNTVNLRSGAFDDALQDVEASYGDAVYGELFRVLCHLSLDPAEAKRLWGEVLGHRGMMQERLGSLLDLRVAMLSYLVDVKPTLEDPKIIERSEFERTQESAYTDHLTGLRNFRFFVQQLNHEVLRSDQYNEPLSLIMLDIDHFKAFNDHHGHEAGNEVLRRVGGIISQTLRKVDVGARYGGEEFAVILPSTPKRGAQAAADRLRIEIAAHDFSEVTRQPMERLTASLGIATYPADGRDASEFIEHCDRALYTAKAEGRNRVALLNGMRSFPRVLVSLEGRFRAAGEEHPFQTIQLGTGGMSFRTTARLELGALIDASLDVPGHASWLEVSGRVLRVKPDRDGWNEVAMHFLVNTPANRRDLANFVRNTEAD